MFAQALGECHSTHAFKVAGLKLVASVQVCWYSSRPIVSVCLGAGDDEKAVQGGSKASSLKVVLDIGFGKGV